MPDWKTYSILERRKLMTGEEREQWDKEQREKRKIRQAEAREHRRQTLPDYIPAYMQNVADDDGRTYLTFTEIRTGLGVAPPELKTILEELIAKAVVFKHPRGGGLFIYSLSPEPYLKPKPPKPPKKPKITPEHHELINFISDHPGLKFKELMQKTGIPQPKLSGLLYHPVEAGIVTRDENRRYFSEF